MVYDEPAVSPTAKAAALVMIANGLLVLVTLIIVGTSQGPRGLGSLVSVALDFVVGGYLLAGSERALWWAKLRVGIGLVVLPFVALAAGGVALAAVQLLFSLGLLVLLMGAPSTLRLAVGVTGTGLCLALEAGAALAMGFGRNPFNRVVLSQQVESAPVRSVEGRAFLYRLSTSSDGWYRRKTELVEREAAGADRWLIHPAEDAHVIVLVRDVGSVEEDTLARLESAVLAHARRSSQAVTVLEQRAIENAQGEGRLLHTRDKRGGQEIEFLYGFYSREQLVYQVTAFTSRRSFARLQPQLLEWVSSLEIPGWEPIERAAVER
jgi:hypothetical protein